MAPRPDAALPADRRFGGGLHRFAGDRRGNITLLTGLLMVPLLMAAGAAIDYGAALRLETRLRAAVDATALLLCQTPADTAQADLDTLARTTLTGQMGADGLVVDPVKVSNPPRQITLTAHKTMTTAFGAFTRTRSIEPRAQAQCTTPAPKTFEIALVLDNTGSMGRAGDDGVSKITALKTAAKSFVGFILSNPGFSTATKISVVPFSVSVAVDPVTYRYASWVDTDGKSPYHWKNFSGTAKAGFKSRFDVFDKLKSAVPSWKWAGCFEALPYPQNVTDTATSGDATLYMPHLAPDESGPGTPGGGDAYWNDNWSRNSYIDDDDGTDSGTCAKLPSNASFTTALTRACKYNTPRNMQTGIFGEQGPIGPNFGCTSQPLQRLTRNSAVLTSVIDNMAAAGSTNINEGLMWGWRTISPKSVFADGAAYGNDAVGKIIVLMTDGVNTWNNNASYAKSLYSANGYFMNADGTNSNFHFPPTNQNVMDKDQARIAMDALTLLACTNAKASPANISIWTIGFSVSSDLIDAAGLDLLKACASSPSQALVANDSTSLIKAFRKVAAATSKPHLSQ